jgi:hypothetical protein
MGGVRVLALDLEGTLISNAVSVFARPGLRGFLEACAQVAPRVVVMTAVRTGRARWVVERLAREGEAPGWFAGVEIVSWEGEFKDLGWISGVEGPSEAVLVDDNQGYVAPGQEGSWVEVRSWDPPYDAADRELDRVLSVLRGVAWC